MAAKESKITSKRLIGAYLSSIFSISLVLLIIGAASLLVVNAKNVSDFFKENLKLSVILRTEATKAQALCCRDRLLSKEWTKSVDYISREQGIQEMEDLLGRDFLSVFDTAPIPISLELSLKADYVTPQIMDDIMKEIRDDAAVDDVVWQKSLVEALNANLRTISLVLSVLVALMLFISLVLIGNTVRLSLYGHRFSIHTMRLVGATRAFIMRPFLGEAAFQGLISALFAAILLLGALIFVKSEFAMLFTIFRLQELLRVLAIMIISGIALCCISTFFIVCRMVSLKKEELYY